MCTLSLCIESVQATEQTPSIAASSNPGKTESLRKTPGRENWEKIADTVFRHLGTKRLPAIQRHGFGPR